MEMYRFEPLSISNKHIWLEAAKRCDYAPVSVLDESQIDSQLKNKSSASVILYDTKDDKAVALFPAEISERKFGPVSLRILASRFGGILVADNNFSQLLSLKDFVFRRVINHYYAKHHKIDCVDVLLPPRVTIENPFYAYGLVPFYHGDTDVNSLLYVKLEDDLLHQFRRPIRKHIRAGLRNMENAQILRRNDKNILKHILALEKSKAALFKVKPLPESHFRRILESPYYHHLLVLLDGRPIVAKACTYCNGVGTSNWTANTELAKKLHINKAIWFTAAKELKEMGAKYFVLGAGWTYAKNRKTKEQVRGVTLFKRRFSTHEVTAHRFQYPLTYKGIIASNINQMRRRKFWKT